MVILSFFQDPIILQKPKKYNKLLIWQLYQTDMNWSDTPETEN